jgi:hypothetical protein
MTDWKQAAQAFVNGLTENEREVAYKALQLIKVEGDAVSDEIPDHVVAFQLNRLMEYLTAVSDEEQ